MESVALSKEYKQTVWEVDRISCLLCKYSLDDMFEDIEGKLMDVDNHLDTLLKYKQDALNKVHQECILCRECVLGNTRKQVVFGEGNVNCTLLMLAESPGEEEDLCGRPLVGRAGKLQDQIINSIGLQRHDIYICNILKCHPPNNKIPSVTIPLKCFKWCKLQIDIIQPKIILSLGSVALNVLKETTGLSILKLRGEHFKYNNITVLPTLHPSRLIRTPAEKKLVWEDMKKLKQMLEDIR